MTDKESNFEKVLKLSDATVEELTEFSPENIRELINEHFTEEELVKIKALQKTLNEVFPE
jgi:hypothetical protein